MNLRKPIRRAICSVLGHLPLLVHLQAQLLRFYAERSLHLKYFHVWEAYGLHMIPVHYFSPIPDTRVIPSSVWSRNSEMPGVDMNDAVQLEFVRSVFPAYEAEIAKLFQGDGRDYTAYQPSNPNFSSLDAAVLYSIVRSFRPNTILEVGGGFSSRVSAAATLHNGRPALTCIEPYPDETLKAGFPGLNALISKQVQDVPLSVFENLTSGDILFIDSSHVAKCGSDVVYLYLEVLPRLKPGVLVHVHDVFFPREYPES